MADNSYSPDRLPLSTVAYDSTYRYNGQGKRAFEP